MVRSRWTQNYIPKPLSLLSTIVVMVSISLLLTGCGSELSEGGYSPVWSPDGSKIVYVYSQYERIFKTYIWVMDSNGKNKRNLTNTTTGRFNYEPAWSPDSKRIVFTAEGEGNSDIWVVDVEGNNRVNLTNSPASDYSPAWSPDGRTIAFISFSNESNLPEIMAVDANGSNLRKLVGSTEGHYSGAPPQPVWSPDGSKILFVYGVLEQDGGHTTEIWIMSDDGSDLRVLMKNAWSPSWSPDGSKIACLSGRAGRTDIWSVDANGNNPIRLTIDVASGPPVWSIDGNKIFFHVFTSPGVHGNIWAMNADGTGARELSNIDIVSPVWSPDRKQIAYVSPDRSPSRFSPGHVCIWVMNVDGTGVKKLTD